MLRPPKQPPAIRETGLLLELFEHCPEAAQELVFPSRDRPSSVHLDFEPKGKNLYPHWDKLRHLKPPDGLTHREWWAVLKIRRQAMAKEAPLSDVQGKPFVYTLADPIPEWLDFVTLQCGGTIGMADQVTSPETRDRYVVRSLIEEAITSSQLEGAATTRQVAREMIRRRRPPHDRGEQMCLNNFVTMQRIRELRHEKLSRDLVCEIHRLVTEKTLDDPRMAGTFRRSDQRVVVDDAYGQVFHVPPPATDLEERIELLCRFANSTKPYLHPVIRSIIVHFWLAYDHPFVDGNGRTARALFYWSMLHHGFWLFEFISISEIILKGPSKYLRAFLYTETDDNDLTYFLIYHLDVIRQAREQLDRYIKRKTSELRQLERRLRGLQYLNHRQQALVSHALRHPNFDYTIESHMRSHNVVHQTARTDLLDLADRNLLKKRKMGRTWHFTPVPEMEERLAVGE